MKLDPTILTAICQLSERAINKALKHDPGTRSGLQTLNGKTFCLDITNINTTLYLLLRDEKVFVVSIYEDQVDCKLSGHANNLLKLIFTENKHNLLNSGVTVIGDVGLLMALTKVSHKLDIDWEEALNDITGDVIGHQLANTIRSLHRKLTHISKQAPFFVGDYLTEELKAIPSEAELHYFYQGVNHARSYAERLERRLDRLLQSSNS